MTITRVAEDRQTEQRTSVASAALRGLRPRQWSKNALVLVAPFVGGQLFRPDVLLATGAAFVAFCLAASSVYLANDALDVEEDRAHPTKRHRPIASGALPVPLAWAMAAVLAAGSLALAFAVTPGLGATLVVYLAVQAGYVRGLKQQPVLDLAIVASGFLMRAVAGGVAADVVLSQWFLLVASFGSLFMVAGKRYSELVQLGASGGTRTCLREYSDSYLRFLWQLAAGVTVVTYCLWALDHSGDSGSFALMSIAPFVLALLRYAVDVDRGVAGAPEDVVLQDRVLLGLGAIWLVLVGLAVMA